MNHTPGLQAATRHASRARLLQFFATVDPSHRFWLDGSLVPAEAMPTDSLRTAAFVVADHFWAVRRTARFWRAYDANPAHRLPPRRPVPGETTVPALRGAELEAWLAGHRIERPVFAIASE